VVLENIKIIDLKNTITNNKYCLILVGSKGCGKCASLIPVLEKVYQRYPSLTYVISPTEIVNKVLAPAKYHAMTTIFFKDGVQHSLLKYSYLPQAYERRINIMLRD